MSRPVYWTLAHIINYTLMNLAATSFWVLTIDNTLKIYNSTYWIA